jgi:hypothetical protein
MPNQAKTAASCRESCATSCRAEVPLLPAVVAISGYFSTDLMSGESASWESSSSMTSSL